MARHFGVRRHERLSPVFDLTRIGYFLDFALVPLAVLFLLAWMPAPFSAEAVVMMATGAAAWTLAEYWIHRLVFHGPTHFAPMHQVHHELPKDMVGVASWGTFAGFGAIALPANAADRPEKPSGWFCAAAKAAVLAAGSEKAAEDAARAQGVPETTVAKAKRCSR